MKYYQFDYKNSFTFIIWKFAPRAVEENSSDS